MGLVGSAIDGVGMHVHRHGCRHGSKGVKWIGSDSRTERESGHWETSPGTRGPCDLSRGGVCRSDAMPNSVQMF